MDVAGEGEVEGSGDGGFGQSVFEEPGGVVLGKFPGGVAGVEGGEVGEAGFGFGGTSRGGRWLGF